MIIVVSGILHYVCKKQISHQVMIVLADSDWILLIAYIAEHAADMNVWHLVNRFGRKVNGHRHSQLNQSTIHLNLMHWNRYNEHNTESCCRSIKNLGQSKYKEHFLIFSIHSSRQNQFFSGHFSFHPIDFDLFYVLGSFMDYLLTAKNVSAIFDQV